MPRNAAVIAAVGGRDNMLILRCGKEKAKNYLTFSSTTNTTRSELGCDPVAFYAAGCSNASGNGCDEDLINGCGNVFIDGRDYGTWTGSRLTIYFSAGKKRSYLLAFDGSNNGIQIDTDFLPNLD